MCGCTPKCVRVLTDGRAQRCTAMHMVEHMVRQTCGRVDGQVDTRAGGSARARAKVRQQSKLKSGGRAGELVRALLLHQPPKVRVEGLQAAVRAIAGGTDRALTVLHSLAPHICDPPGPKRPSAPVDRVVDDHYPCGVGKKKSGSFVLLTNPWPVPEVLTGYGPELSQFSSTGRLLNLGSQLSSTATNPQNPSKFVTVRSFRNKEPGTKATNRK